MEMLAPQAVVGNNETSTDRFGNDVRIAFSVLEAGVSRAAPAKTYGVSADGSPKVTIHGAQPSSGTIERTELTGRPGDVLAELGRFLDTLTSRQALICVPPPIGQNVWKFSAKDIAEDRTDTIARTRKYFPATAGPALMGLDFDTKAWPSELAERVRAESDQISGILRKTIPGYSGSAVLRRASSSAGIRNTITRQTTDANGGQHRFLIVKDGRDISRAAEVIHNRLILAGWCYGVVYESGGFDVRSLIDKNASAGSERLWYEGRVQLASELLEIDPRARCSEVFNENGGLLDTSEIPDLSQSERSEIASIIEEMREMYLDKISEAKRAWKERRARELIASGVDKLAALEIVGRAAEKQELVDDFVVSFDDGTSASVDEIVADPEKYHRKTGPDPMEPDYGGGKNIAILYADKEPFRIESQAHGGISYRLISPSRYFDVLEDDGPQRDEGATTTSVTTYDAPRSPVEGSQSLRWIDPTLWAGTSIPERQWVVRGWIPKGEVTLLYGDGGVGKTLVAQQLATSAAAGIDWLGQPTRQSRVMCFFCEDSESELHRRQADIVAALGVEWSGLGGLRLLSRRSDDNLLCIFDRSKNCMQLTQLFHDLCFGAKAFAADLVIIDTIADTFGGNENDRAQVNAFAKACLGRLASEINGTVLALGHPSRAGKQTGEGSSGSTHWNNAVRSRLYLEGAKDPASPVRSLKVKKANYGPREAELKLQYSKGHFRVIAGSTIAPRNDLSAGSQIISISDAVEAAILSVLADRPNERLARARNSPYFAPRRLANLGGALFDPFTEEQVAAGIQRLLDSGKVRDGAVGRDGSGRSVPGLIPVWDKMAEGSPAASPLAPVSVLTSEDVLSRTEAGSAPDIFH